MLKIFIEYSFEIVVTELIIALLACCVSYSRHKQVIRLIPVFLTAFAICSFLSLVLLPFPVKIEYPDNYSYDFMSQFAKTDIDVFISYLPERIAANGRYISTPLFLSLFTSLLFAGMRKPLAFLLSLIGAESAYFILNIAINSGSRYTMTKISAGNAVFIAVGYAVGWLICVLITKAFPSIDKRLGITNKKTGEQT